MRIIKQFLKGIVILFLSIIAITVVIVIIPIGFCALPFILIYELGEI